MSRTRAERRAGQRAEQKRTSRTPRRGFPRAVGIALACAAGVALIAVAVPGVRHWSERPRRVEFPAVATHGAAQGYNVVLVTLDTVRSDHLGFYGDTKAQTPRLDALAKHGVRFDHAATTAPITMPSHASMMTGLYPPSHGVRDNGLFQLAPEHDTLAESMKAQGYGTAAFVGCFVLDRRFGLDQGFDTYDFRVGAEGFYPSNLDMNQRSARDVSDAAIGWLQTRDPARPFFLWVHYFDAHVPYQSPLARLPQFAGRPYDAEIANVDQELGRLLDELDRTGGRDRTLIVVAADHGEGLGGHGESTHGLFLYGDTVRAAFLLSCPSLFHGAWYVDDRVASLADLRPTVEDILGFPAAPGMEGVSLLRADTPADRAVYAETRMPYYNAGCSPLEAMITAKDKLIEGPEPEYYRLDSDSAETRNAWQGGAERVQDLGARLAGMQRKWSDGTPSPAAREMTAEESQRLASLGYVSASAEAPPPTENLPDPKAMLRATERVGEALRLAQQGRVEDALREADAARKECPGLQDALLLQVDLHERAGNTDQAMALLRESLAARPSVGAALALARLYMVARQYDRMEDALATVSRLDPLNGFVHVLRGDRRAQEGRWAEARTEYEEALRIDPNRVGALVRPQLDKIRGRSATAG